MLMKLTDAPLTRGSVAPLKKGFTETELICVRVSRRSVGEFEGC